MAQTSRGAQPILDELNSPLASLRAASPTVCEGRATVADKLVQGCRIHANLPAQSHTGQDFHAQEFVYSGLAHLKQYGNFTYRQKPRIDLRKNQHEANVQHLG